MDRYNNLVECYEKELIEFEDLEKEYKELLPEDFGNRLLESIMPNWCEGTLRVRGNGEIKCSF